MEKNEKLKQYNNRDEFINDDGLTTEEKIEICESLLESITNDYIESVLERGE